MFNVLTQPFVTFFMNQTTYFTQKIYLRRQPTSGKECRRAHTDAYDMSFSSYSFSSFFFILALISDLLASITSQLIWLGQS